MHPFCDHETVIFHALSPLLCRELYRFTRNFGWRNNSNCFRINVRAHGPASTPNGLPSFMSFHLLFNPLDNLFFAQDEPLCLKVVICKVVWVQLSICYNQLLWLLSLLFPFNSFANWPLRTLDTADHTLLRFLFLSEVRLFSTARRFIIHIHSYIRFSHWLSQLFAHILVKGESRARRGHKFTTRLLNNRGLLKWLHAPRLTIPWLIWLLASHLERGLEVRNDINLPNVQNRPRLHINLLLHVMIHSNWFLWQKQI